MEAKDVLEGTQGRCPLPLGGWEARPSSSEPPHRARAWPAWPVPQCEGRGAGGRPLSDRTARVPRGPRSGPRSPPVPRPGLPWRQLGPEPGPRTRRAHRGQRAPGTRGAPRPWGPCSPSALPPPLSPPPLLPSPPPLPAGGGAAAPARSGPSSATQRPVSMAAARAAAQRRARPGRHRASAADVQVRRCGAGPAGRPAGGAGGRPRRSALAWSARDAGGLGPLPPGGGRLGPLPPSVCRAVRGRATPAPRSSRWRARPAEPETAGPAQPGGPGRAPRPLPPPASLWSPSDPLGLPELPPCSRPRSSGLGDRCRGRRWSPLCQSSRPAPPPHPSSGSPAAAEAEPRLSPREAGQWSGLSAPHPRGLVRRAAARTALGAPGPHLAGCEAGAQFWAGTGRSPALGRSRGSPPASPRSLRPVAKVYWGAVWVDTLGPRKSLPATWALPPQARALHLCVPPPAGSPPRRTLPTPLRSAVWQILRGVPELKSLSASCHVTGLLPTTWKKKEGVWLGSGPVVGVRPGGEAQPQSSWNVLGLGDSLGPYLPWGAPPSRSKFSPSAPLGQRWGRTCGGGRTSPGGWGLSA